MPFAVGDRVRFEEGNLKGDGIVALDESEGQVCISVGSQVLPINVANVTAIVAPTPPAVEMPAVAAVPTGMATQEAALVVEKDRLLAENAEILAEILPPPE
jgi:hypothetical protein